MSTATISPPSTVRLADLIGTAALSHPDGVVVRSLIDGRPVEGDVVAATRVSPGSVGLNFVSHNLGAAGVDAAVASVRRGFDEGSWGRTTGRDRAKVLYRAAELVARDTERLAALLVVEAGKPIRDARGEVGSLVNSFEYFAGAARMIGGRTESGIAPGVFAMTVREASGVAGLIIPWNFPLGILGQKLPPALAAGNTVVLKPSPLTPLTALAVAEILFEAGLPTDALSIVLGEGDAGSQIVEHFDTDVISFTGSTGVGRAIASSAGRNRLKPVAIEAGGKTPVIILRSANLDEVIEGLMFSAFFNQGQVCVAGSRLFVEDAIADEFSAGFAARTSAIRVGNPWSEPTELGPLVSDAHRDSVEARIAQSIDGGAILVTGGSRVDVTGLPDSPFLQPTILSSEDDSNVSVSQEVFGPVTVIQRFTDVKDAVARANRQAFGLAASVWGHDVDETFSAASRLKVGTVWINGSTDSYPEVPLGGRRDSGFGAEFGREGLEFFTSLKTIHLRTGGPLSPRYFA
jgi:betaine-aldehyde dehydrogenase